MPWSAPTHVQFLSPFDTRQVTSYSGCLQCTLEVKCQAQ